MKIDNNLKLVFQNINFNNIFKKGDVFTGKIIEVKGNFILIDIKGLGIVNAVSEVNLKEYIGSEVDFTIKYVDEKIVSIKPNINKMSHQLYSNSLNKKEEFIGNILKEFKIEETKLNIEFIKSLMEYSVSLDEDTIYLGVNILEKLKEKVNIYEYKPKNNEEFENSIRFQDFTLDKANEKIHAEEDYINFQLKGMTIDEKVELLAKTIAFFIKYDIVPTIKNIKNFIELNLDIQYFSKDYEILKNIIDKEFTNLPKNIIIGIENLNSENLKNLIENNKNAYLKNLNEIIKFFKYRENNYNKEITNTIENLESKLDLLNQLNNHLTFIYLPIDLKGNLSSNNILALIKKKKKKYDYQDSVNVFITLKTRNFGKVSVYCKVINNNMKIEFSNLSDENIDFFKTKEHELKSLIESTGYDVVSIEYVRDKGAKILDVLGRNYSPLYCLDVKV